MAGAFLLLRRKGGSTSVSEQTATAAIAAPHASSSGPETGDTASITPSFAPASSPSTGGDAGQNVLSSAAAARIAIPAHTSNSELMANNIRLQVEKDPSATANILRAWIADSHEDDAR